MAILINIHDGMTHLYKIVEIDGMALIYKRIKHDNTQMLKLFGEISLSKFKDNPNGKVEIILSALALKAWLAPFTLIEHENGEWTHE
jgi:hypothetical protein